MLGEHPGRILHRHVIAGERHQLAAERAVQAVERRGLKRTVCRIVCSIVYRHAPSED
ncbi:MAG: hypothetical protein WDO24_31215 [Pseudomonadota bacterium]